MARKKSQTCDKKRSFRRKSMRYTVEGKLADGRSVRIIWIDGRLQGDEETIRLVEHMAEMLEGVETEVSPTGPFYTSYPLSNPLATLCVIREVLEIDRMTGKVPTVPYVKGRIY
jgi:hypothetical protein